MAVHMLDVAPAGYRYNLYEYLRDARRAMAGIAAPRAPCSGCGRLGALCGVAAQRHRPPRRAENPPSAEASRARDLDELAAMLAAMKTLHNVTDIDNPRAAPYARHRNRAVLHRQPRRRTRRPRSKPPKMP